MSVLIQKVYSLLFRLIMTMAKRIRPIPIHWVRFTVSFKTIYEIITEAGVSTEQCAFVGDDTLDIAVFDRVGLSVAVADAHEDVRRAADYITKAAGGRGAVREIIDILLAARSSY